MIAYDLQFFAKEGPGGEKTEEPTAKKLDDVRKEGQVAKSKEVVNAAGLIALFVILKFGMGFLGENFLGVFSYVYDRIPQLIKMANGFIPSRDYYSLMGNILLKILITISPFLLIGFLVAFLADYVQIKWKVTSKPLQPKFSKLNPVNGFKRIFSAQSLMELLKSIAKILLIGWVAYDMIKDNFDVIYLLFNMPLWQGIQVSGKIAIDFGLKCSLIYVVIALIDFAYQKRKFHKDQMMTKQEVKDEYKQSEGDPQVKGRIRQKMQEASRRRMMQKLPEADVVITNPTHFAVAIQYDSEVASAPVVIAKGEDFLAQKIKEIAKENKVEIVENKPLARMLYYNVEIGEQVPPELYQAVAEVLAMVYHMQGKI
ncbi:MAG: flagellar biosynthesis protein FlhB [Lachnospiraceae bacterium]